MIKALISAFTSAENGYGVCSVKGGSAFVCFYPAFVHTCGVIAQLGKMNFFRNKSYLRRKNTVYSLAFRKGFKAFRNSDTALL